MLHGMAAVSSSIVVTGAVLSDGSGNTPHDASGDSDSDSLLNRWMAQRMEHNQLINDVIRICGDDSWHLEIDDIVYLGSEAFPQRVIKVGYGDYEREVRVAGVGEDISDRRAGRWVRTGRLHLLEVDDSLEVLSELYDATEAKQVITMGTVCTSCGWDSDGDALVRVGLRTIAAFIEDFGRIMALTCG